MPKLLILNWNQRYTNASIKLSWLRIEHPCRCSIASKFLTPDSLLALTSVVSFKNGFIDKRADFQKMLEDLGSVLSSAEFQVFSLTAKSNWVGLIGDLWTIPEVHM